MHRTALIIASAIAIGWAGTASAQTVTLTLKDGRATLTTQNASVRQILAEWERLGQVRIVGADRLAASQPLTISLSDVPERQALDIILRGVPGYMVIDRAASAAGASRYDRLVLLARTTTPVPAQTAASTSSTPSPAQAYVQTMDQAAAAGVAEEMNDEAEPPMPVAPVVNPYPIGAQGNTQAGGNAGPAVLNSGSATVTAGPPETQFDYANPQRYFDRMRQQQQQQQQAGQQPGQTATPVAPYPGSTLDAPPAGTTPSAVPSATGTSAKPGIAPTPTPPQQQQIFNPYNLPPEQLQGGGTTSSPPSSTTPVEPDRAKYANPYVPTPTTRPPQ
jgi:hypothetical protein